jgi:hypothetical protein|tara:strand:+ start:603 stop:806 length:204 start_codon:yes stop_codon:yes gene_type:complete
MVKSFITSKTIALDQVPTTAKKQKGESRSNNLMPPLHKQEKERYLRINSLEMTRFLMTTGNLVFSSD